MKIDFSFLFLLIFLLSTEGLLQQLISLKWSEPELVEVLGHYLDSFGPFLRYYPDAVGSVINKLFELLNSLPFMVKVILLPCFKYCIHSLVHSLLVLSPTNICRIHLLAQLVVQDCKYVHLSFESLKLLMKAFCLT